MPRAASQWAEPPRLRPGPASDLESELLIQVDGPGAKRHPRYSPPAEKIMIYDSKLTEM